MNVSTASCNVKTSLGGEKQEEAIFWQHSKKKMLFFFLAGWWRRSGRHKTCSQDERLTGGGPTRPRGPGKETENWCVPGRASPTVSLSMPEWPLVPCRPLHIQRLVGRPCLEVARRRVAVTVGTGVAGRPGYTRLSRNARRSSLAVPTVLTVAQFARLTWEHSIRVTMLVARYEGLVLIFWGDLFSTTVTLNTFKDVWLLQQTDSDPLR